MESLPEKIRETVKNVYNTAYRKGLAVGAYSISTIVLQKLRENKNPALARANVIKFLMSNKSVARNEQSKTNTETEKGEK
jgi:hypothetical protein